MPVITINIPDDLLAKIDNQAQTEGYSRIQFILLTLEADIAGTAHEMEPHNNIAERVSLAGSALRAVNSPAQQEAARANGKKGGNVPPKPGSRPRGRPRRQVE